MTPKEKIEYVKREIDERTEISPKGPITIRLYSVDEYEDGPTLLTKSEQKLIIKKLEEDGYIKNVEIRYDGSIIWVDLEKIDKKSEAERDYLERLFLLKIFYSKLLEICDVFANKFIAVRDTALNHYYTVLSSLVDDILNRPEFAEFKADKPELFESLIGDITDYDMEWEYGSRPAFALLGRLEKKFILAGAPTYELPTEYKTFLEKVNEAIDNHKKYNIETWQQIEKNVDKNKEKLGWDNGPKNEKKDDKTIRVEIVNDLGIKGLEKSLEAIAKNNKKADGPKFPYKLPAGTKWENITVKFEDDNKVFIKVKQLEHYTNFKDMGFIGKGNNPVPSEAWVFLRVLSMARITGEVAITDKEAREKWKAQKGILGEGLQSYFSIDYDPFYPYNSSNEKIGKSYKIKLTLIPPEPKAPEDKPDEKDEIKEFLTQEAPQVFEE